MYLQTGHLEGRYHARNILLLLLLLLIIIIIIIIVIYYELFSYFFPNQFFQKIVCFFLVLT